LAHAQSDAGPNFIAGDRRSEEVATAKTWAHFGERQQRRQRNGSNVHYADAVDIVELESLHQRPID
jgi:hypothetical protein